MKKFIIPSIEYISSYIEALKICEDEGFPDFISTSEEIEENPEEFIKKINLLDSSKCIQIKDFISPSKRFWLVDMEKKEYIGHISIRYNLSNDYMKKFGGHIGYMVNPKYRKQGYGSQLLKYGLEIAQEISLGEVLITCNENNIGSKKIIEKYNGKFIDKIYNNKENMNKLRYRIILNKSAHKLWINFLRKNENIDEFSYITWSFGATPDELLDLVLTKKKTACSSLYSDEYCNILRNVDFSVILDSKDEAKCIVKHKPFIINKFKDISIEFAKKEGEGDLSLAFWRKTHNNFFKNYLGEEFNENIDLILEEFQLV